MKTRPLPVLTARLIVGLLAGLAFGPTAVAADKPDAEGIAFFEKKIRPVFAKHCYSCHSGSVQARGGLRVDTRVGLLIGGQSGPAVVPKDVEKSKIISVLKYAGPEMPPAEQLPESIVADFVKWIEIGAPDPRGEENQYHPLKRINVEESKKEWQYQAPRKPAVPQTPNAAWAWSDTDRFVLAHQQKVGTTPVADADALTWLRRVSFDLVGLPPTEKLIARLQADSSQASREKIVDELLASPQFGERWGRHWLDVARYAESTGKERNFIYPQAWRYRNWVIDAVNEDKPYNQFLKEQIAGDLLPAENSVHADANAVATGFLALGPKGINERNKESYLLDIVDEQIENIGRAVLGLSVSCARCHDHKFDPISMGDYYSLAGIFRSTEVKAGIINRTRNGGQPQWLVPLPSAGSNPTEGVDKELLANIDTLEKEARRRIDDFRRSRELATAEVLAAVSAATPITAINFVPGPRVLSSGEILPGEDPEPDYKAPAVAPAPGSFDDIRAKQRALGQVNRQLDALRLKLARITADRTAAGVVDAEDPKDISIRLRGEADNLGPVVPRGFLRVVSVANSPAVNPKQSGRVELADWLTRPDNPLTARVAVNRIWAKLFGIGIVPTPDDFGDQGQKASNPQLLDHLAVRFVEQGWSLKKTLRELVLTRTYQLAGTDHAGNLAKDEANVSLWRWNRKRLDGEALRDAILTASGQLRTERPAGSPVLELGVIELSPVTDYSPIEAESRHRSVYLPVLRNKLPEALGIFDMPDPSLVVAQRDATTSPGQALYLLNSPFALEQSGLFARRLLSDPKRTDQERIDEAYWLALSRLPTKAERDHVLKFVGGATDANRAAVWTQFVQAIIALPEFRYLF